MSTQTWRIIYTGIPTNPRFRVHKKRIARVITDEAGAHCYAADLEHGLHGQVLAIQEAAQ